MQQRPAGYDRVFACGTSSQRVLAENPRRAYALLVNDGSATIYIRLGLPAVANQGIRLNASGGSYEITWLNLWQGEVYAIGDATNPSLLVTEY